MHLKILLPSRIFAEVEEISGIVADTREGSFGLLPRRLDCVAALVPGILAYRNGTTIDYVAVDEGVLIKVGENVTISVRRAIRGGDLGALHDAVKREFLALDDEARLVRTAVAKLESGLIARLAVFHHAG